MKNKFKDSSHLVIDTSADENEQRIRKFREAFLNGTFEIDSTRLAQKIMDFEKQLDGPGSPPGTPFTVSSRQ